VSNELRTLPAWKFYPELIPPGDHLDYVYSLKIMDRKKARAEWREGIKSCWDNRCAFCNGVPIDDESLTLDHVRPRSRGGQDLTRNLVPACSRCNSNKGSQDWQKWFQLQRFYCPIRAREIESWMKQGDRQVDEWWNIGAGDLDWCWLKVQEWKRNQNDQEEEALCEPPQSQPQPSL